jgi:hypothetical protein
VIAPFSPIASSCRPRRRRIAGVDRRGGAFGTGPQRGVGLLLTAMGLTTIVLSVAAFASPRLRLIEDELPEIHSAD